MLIVIFFVFLAHGLSCNSGSLCQQSSLNPKFARPSIASIISKPIADFSQNLVICLFVFNY